MNYEEVCLVHKEDYLRHIQEKLELYHYARQLAALAQTHLLISKEARQGRTYTTVTPLDREGRKRELARIIGGTHITETTLKSAEEMLQG